MIGTNIKFIRLITGEDIVANCLMDDKIQCVDIENPMKVYISRFNESKKSILVMMPWLPLEVVDTEYVTLKVEDILTMANPKEVFIEYYRNTVDKYNELLKTTSHENMFSDELGEEYFEEEFTDEEIAEHDEESLEEALEELKTTKKVLH